MLSVSRRITNHGFTLMELLVVFSIIAILATVGLASYFTAHQKGRDAKRKADLEQIQRALEMYYNDYISYPDSLTFGEQFTDGTSVYMEKLPNDPKSEKNYQYYYSTEAGANFALYACLENENDPQRKAGGYSATDCGSGCITEGSGLCNYGISSPNREP